MESGGSYCTWSGAGGSAGRVGLRWWTRLNSAKLSDEVSLMSLMALVSLPATEVSSLALEEDLLLFRRRRQSNHVWS
jgi:hypothetical protein